VGFTDALIAASVPITGQQFAIGIALAGSITVQINISGLEFSVHPIWNPISESDQTWIPIGEMGEIWVPISESDQTWIPVVGANPRFTS